MPRLYEIRETRLPAEEAFAFAADFANAARWDPGVAASEALVPGPPSVGSRYRLGVRMRGRVVPMEYRVTAWEPSRRVVLEGAGSGVHAIDEIRFEPTAAGGTRVDYTADIRLAGWMRLVEPLAGDAFRRLAREALDGMQRALDERVSAGSAAPR